MKVSVTVDENIYPELYELMKSTPVSKRARVLANLAFKACLLSNVALMNSELTAPTRGRSATRKKTVKPVQQKNDGQVNEGKTLSVENIISEPTVSVVKAEKTTSGYIKDENPQTENAQENSFSVNAGVSEKNFDQVSDDQGNSAGEGEDRTSAPQPVVARKRRILG